MTILTNPPGLMADPNAWQTAHEADIRSRTEFPRPGDARAATRCCPSSHASDAICGHFESGYNGRCLRCDHEKRCHGPGASEAAMIEEMSEIDRVAEKAMREHSDPPTHYRAPRPHHCDCSADADHQGVCTRQVPADSVVLTGAQAEQYKRLMAAAAEAAVVTARMKSTSEALRDAFQQFCAGIATGEPR